MLELNEIFFSLLKHLMNCSQKSDTKVQNQNLIKSQVSTPNEKNFGIKFIST